MNIHINVLHKSNGLAVGPMGCGTTRNIHISVWSTYLDIYFLQVRPVENSFYPVIPDFSIALDAMI